jgi:exosome complex component RRP45
MAGGLPVARCEVEFALQALREERVRIDGRPLNSYRRLGLRFGDTHGQVEVSLGPTRALAVCSGEIIIPPPERPNEGRINFHVEFGPIASPGFEPGRPSAQATAVGNFIERLLRGSRAIDTEALCIIGGQQVWSIRVDVRALNDDGNLADACAIAALCSMMHFRKADVEISGGTAKVYSLEDRVPVPLSIHFLPVPVTFALFAPGDKEDKQPTVIIDPSRLEEAAMCGILCIAVNQHGELCGLHKPGGMPIDFELIEQCTEIATAKTKEILAKIQSELDADLAKRKQARRNVHELYDPAQILTVDLAFPASVPLATSTSPATAQLGSTKIDAQLAAIKAEAAELEHQLAMTTAQEAASAPDAAAIAENGSFGTLAKASVKGRKKKKRKVAT